MFFNESHLLINCCSTKIWRLDILLFLVKFFLVLANQDRLSKIFTLTSSGSVQNAGLHLQLIRNSFVWSGADLEAAKFQSDHRQRCPVHQKMMGGRYHASLLGTAAENGRQWHVGHIDLQSVHSFRLGSPRLDWRIWSSSLHNCIFCPKIGCWTAAKDAEVIWRLYFTKLSKRTFCCGFILGRFGQSDSGNFQIHDQFSTSSNSWKKNSFNSY